MKLSFYFPIFLAPSALAGEVLWSGIFNSSFTVADFDKWSWSNKIEPWQWYIHGNASTSRYLEVSPHFKNPADASDAQGIKITIDGTSFWNGQTMERSEIIPQTSQNIGTGHLYYHFSLMTRHENPPNQSFEHQVAFFENHFTELKYGLSFGQSGVDNTLRWCVGGVAKWTIQLNPCSWYNFAYNVNFNESTVGLWASNGSEPLREVIWPMNATTSTDSADWHIGQLRLPNNGLFNPAPEDWYWSGVYVETAPITESVAGPVSEKSRKG
ncbi:hypothetical protein Egran_05184 [Elaphomyces granulatus]|uniref:Glycoside hydrolase 131 catalytic N-terminal domain-containing protein n=1 Tax=Elaphomyces granulatus TaxID=519963 RepID=A0A232LSB0_9EURO|nr:hypothetical protein Egran_05184 [Elaphomyces granulatus]